MENQEQKYVVVATDRAASKRKAITSPMSESRAIEEKNRLNSQYSMRKLYRYFHVAKHPYKTKATN